MTKIKVIRYKEWIKGKWYQKKMATPDQNKMIIDQIKGLLRSEKTMIVSYRHDDQIISKAMYIARHNDFFELWANTDLTSDMVSNLNDGEIFALYLFDKLNIRGLLLQGKAEIETDFNIIQQCFKTDMTDWYDGGIRSEDYVVLKFIVTNIKYFADSAETHLEIERQ